MTCDRSDCAREARWTVCLRFRPPRRLGNVPATATLALSVCDACRERVRLEDLVSDEAWTTVCRAFALAGRVPPARDRTELFFVPLDGTPESRGN